MFLDRQYRVVSYHDTWISIDPIVGCPFSCKYCVLRHSNGTGTRSRVMMSPDDCVKRLLEYPLFVRGVSRLAIGNETDMLHVSNVEYLLQLLNELKRAEIDNCITVITKAPLCNELLMRIRSIGLRIVFCLSYSGLGPSLEPNFTNESLRANFFVAKHCGFPILHFWRPLLPQNTTDEAITTMLSFVSGIADASVFVGLKLHPALTNIIGRDEAISVPNDAQQRIGEWLEPTTIERIYSLAQQICPNYPLYRHTSCALAKIMTCSNHTGTVYRADICPSSHCPAEQRRTCEQARHIPSEPQIAEVLARLGRPVAFSRAEDSVRVTGAMTQEEYCYTVQNLSCPVSAASVQMQNLYFGNINEGRWAPSLSR